MTLCMNDLSPFLNLQSHIISARSDLFIIFAVHYLHVHSTDILFAQRLLALSYLDLGATKPVFRVSDQVHEIKISLLSYKDVYKLEK